MCVVEVKTVINLKNPGALWNFLIHIMERLHKDISGYRSLSFAFSVVQILNVLFRGNPIPTTMEGNVFRSMCHSVHGNAV